MPSAVGRSVANLRPVFLLWSLPLCCTFHFPPLPRNCQRNINVQSCKICLLRAGSRGGVHFGEAICELASLYAVSAAYCLAERGSVPFFFWIRCSMLYCADHLSHQNGAQASRSNLTDFKSRSSLSAHLCRNNAFLTRTAPAPEQALLVYCDITSTLLIDLACFKVPA